MYPHPELNSFIQGFDARVPKKILNRAVNKAMIDKTSYYGIKSSFPRVFSSQPQFFAPTVDVTRANCAFDTFAIPKLIRELHSEDHLTVRQSVTTLGDILVNPEKLIEAVKHNMVDRLSDLLISEDPYLRERVGAIFATIATQAVGRESILKNLGVLANLSKGINDRCLAVRLQVATVLEVLAQDYCAIHLLRKCGFVESVATMLDVERIDVLTIRLEILKFLLHHNIRDEAINCEVFDKLTTLLERKNEAVLLGALSCLSILCENVRAKLRAIKVDLLNSLKIFIEDNRGLLSAEACRLISFVTTTTPGKLRVLELGMLPLLLRLATDECLSPSKALLLAIIKALTNIAEAPEGRATLLRNIELVESIDVGCNEVRLQHKQTLLDVILWKP